MIHLCTIDQISVLRTYHHKWHCDRSEVKCYTGGHTQCHCNGNTVYAGEWWHKWIRNAKSTEPKILNEILMSSVGDHFTDLGEGLTRTPRVVEKCRQPRAVIKI